LRFEGMSTASLD